MLYILAEQLGFPGLLNLIRYISFRAGAATATALMIGLLIGPAGLYALSRRRDPVLTDVNRRDMATAFIAMLFLVALTGLLLLALRDTRAMGVLLAIHLGTVLGLFLSLPYGKFVHGLYRFLALVKYAAERRRGVFID